MAKGKSKQAAETTPTRGRPTSYRTEYCEQLIQHMQQGLSFESFSATIGVDRSTLYEWEKVQADFSDAKRRGRELQQAWWERQGVEGLFAEHEGRRLNSTVWIFAMKNIAGWRDKIEAEHSGPNGGPIPLEIQQLSDAELEARMRKALEGDE